MTRTTSAGVSGSQAAVTGQDLSAWRATAGVVLSCVLILISATARAQTADVPLWGTDGSVGAIVRSGNTLYIGGGFTKVGPSTGGGVPLFGDSARLSSNFPKVAGNVYAVVADGRGGWIIGGFFSAVGGRPRHNLAHVSASGVVSDWDPRPDGVVRAITCDSNSVYVGGGFQTVEGQHRRGLAAFDRSLATMRAWDPSVHGEVLALCSSAGLVFVGGEFDSVGGLPRSNLAQIDGAGIPTACTTGANDAVLALAMADTSVLLGGRFSQVGGRPRGLIAAVSRQTGALTDWDPVAQGVRPNPYAPEYPAVAALAVVDTVVYVGGNFVSIGGASRASLASLSLRTGEATAWAPMVGPIYAGFPPPLVKAIGTAQGRLFVVGQFGVIDDQARGGGASFLIITGGLTAWNPRANAPISCLALGQDQVYVGGEFTTLAVWQARSGLAALDARTGELLPWDPHIDVAAINAIAVHAGKVYVGGLFSHVGGVSRSNLACVDSASTDVTAFDPQANGMVNALVLDGDHIFVGGQFSIIGGLPRGYLACVDATTGAALAWDAKCADIVRSIVLHRGIVYAGGLFSSAGGQSRAYLAALDAGSAAVTTWDPSADGPVNAMAVLDSTVYVGGDFNFVGGQGRDGVAALDFLTGAARPWTANASRQVYSLAAAGRTVYVGGGFSSIGGAPHFCVAAIDAEDGVVTNWDPGVDGVVWALEVSGGSVYAGGSFQTAGGEPCASLASLRGVESESQPPHRLARGRMLPNPVRSRATLQFELPRSSPVRLSVYDVQGRRVLFPLHDTAMSAGINDVSFDVSGIKSGCYLYRLEACGQSAAGKLVVLR